MTYIERLDALYSAALLRAANPAATRAEVLLARSRVEELARAIVAEASRILGGR